MTRFNNGAVFLKAHKNQPLISFHGPRASAIKNPLAMQGTHEMWVGSRGGGGRRGIPTLRNSMERGAWQTTVRGVANSQM